MTAGFLILAALTLGGAITAVAARDLTRSALAMAVSFLGAAGLFALAGAEMLAVFQLLIYVGAIAVLIVFAITLTGRRRGPAREFFTSRPAYAIIACGLIGLLGTWAVFLANAVAVAPSAPRNLAIAKLLFGKLALPFEATSALLLAAAVAAITLAGGSERQ